MRREIPTKLVVVGFVGIFYVAVGTIWVQNFNFIICNLANSFMTESPSILMHHLVSYLVLNHHAFLRYIFLYHL